MTSTNDNNTAGYEKRDVKLVSLAVVSIIMIFVVIVTVIFLFDYFIAVKEEMIYNIDLKQESKELIELVTQENEILSSYKIFDAENGIYYIPIEKAMQLLVEEENRANSTIK